MTRARGIFVFYIYDIIQYGKCFVYRLLFDKNYLFVVQRTNIIVYIQTIDKLS